MEEPNYLVQAFKSQYNLIGLGTALGFAILSGTALPLLVAAGAQMVILPLVAGSERYKRLIRARLLEEQASEKQRKRHLEASEMLRELAEGERQRYHGLETLTREIRENYKGLEASSRILLDEVVQKLDFLMSFYLRMRYSLARYDGYLATTDPLRIERRIKDLEQEAQEGPPRIQAIKARTKGVLLKRLERYKKAEENRQLVDAQTETVLEVLQLLRDQSYSMSDPREISAQLDGLVSAAEETERGVKDMEDILSTEDELMLGGSLASLDSELAALGAAETPSKPVARVPVSAPPSAEPVPRESVKETHVSGR
ncbi:MAG TPA: hypothetical protein VI589_06520, partial [Vicinamibacteria bacterium]